MHSDNPSEPDREDDQDNSNQIGPDRTRDDRATSSAGRERQPDDWSSETLDSESTDSSHSEQLEPWLPEDYETVTTLDDVSDQAGLEQLSSGLNAFTTIIGADLTVVSKERVVKTRLDTDVRDLDIDERVFLLKADGGLRRLARNGATTHETTIPDAERVVTIMDRDVLAVVTSNRQIRFFESEDLFESSSQSFPTAVTEDVILKGGLTAAIVATGNRCGWYYVDEVGNVQSYSVQFDHSVVDVAQCDDIIVVYVDDTVFGYDAATGEPRWKTTVKGITRLTTRGRDNLLATGPNGLWSVSSEGQPRQVQAYGSDVSGPLLVEQTPVRSLLFSVIDGEATVYRRCDSVDVNIETERITPEQDTVSVRVQNLTEEEERFPVAIGGAGLTRRGDASIEPEPDSDGDVDTGETDASAVSESPASLESTSGDGPEADVGSIAVDRDNQEGLWRESITLDPGESRTLTVKNVVAEPTYETATLAVLIGQDPRVVETRDVAVEPHTADLSVDATPKKITQGWIKISMTIRNEGSKEALDIKVDSRLNHEKIPDELEPEDEVTFFLYPQIPDTEDVPAQVSGTLTVQYQDPNGFERQANTSVDVQCRPLSVDANLGGDPEQAHLNLRVSNMADCPCEETIEIASSHLHRDVSVECSIEAKEDARVVIPLPTPGYGTVQTEITGAYGHLDGTQEALNGSTALDVNRVFEIGDGRRTEGLDRISISDTVTEQISVHNRSPHQVSNITVADGESIEVDALDTDDEISISRRHTIYGNEVTLPGCAVYTSDGVQWESDSMTPDVELSEFHIRALLAINDRSPQLVAWIGNDSGQPAEITDMRIEGVNDVTESQQRFEVDSGESRTAVWDLQHVKEVKSLDHDRIPVTIGIGFNRSRWNLLASDEHIERTLVVPVVDHSEYVTVDVSRKSTQQSTGGELWLSIENTADHSVSNVNATCSAGRQYESDREEVVEIGSLDPGVTRQLNTADFSTAQLPFGLVVDGYTEDGTEFKNGFDVKNENPIEVIRSSKPLLREIPSLVTESWRNKPNTTK